MELARSMIAWKSGDKQRWAEAITTTVYITNRIPCSGWRDKTPIEVSYRTRPNLSNLCVFCSKAFGHIKKSERKRMNDNGFPFMFVGHSTMT